MHLADLHLTSRCISSPRRRRRRPQPLHDRITALCHQLVELGTRVVEKHGGRARLAHAPVGHEQDQVVVDDRIESVGDREDGGVLELQT